jgi:Tfp pilus assembly protein PilX
MKDNTRIRNEEGSVIVLSMVLLVLLTMLGISATRTSTIEVQIASNEIHAVQNLYHAEAGEHFALETSDTWMTDPFLTTADNLAYVNSSIDPSLTVDIDADGTNDVTVEIRCIEGSGSDITALTDSANDLPVQRHITPPPVGSGYSLRDYEVRRYGVTATSTSGNSKVQIGAYRIFNKF